MSLGIQERVPHGGDLDEIRARFPDAPEPWIDLSTGINPDPYALPDLPASCWSRLPRASEELDLRIAAARRYGAPHPDMVVSAPGTQALIQMLPRLVRPSKVAILSPTYAEHAVAWRREGHDVLEIPGLSMAGSARIVVVVNPNNPTGTIIAVSSLLELAAELRARDGLLVVDEAFADVLPAEVSLAGCVPDGVIVLRSFGKMYGLAGLRLGFAIAQEKYADRLRDLLGPWAVAGPALHIGQIALGDEKWICDTLARLSRDQSRLDGLLMAQGCEVVGGTALFRLVQHPQAPRIAHTLRQHGIHVRHFQNNRAWLRFGIPGSESAWKRVESALRAAVDA